LHLVYGTKNYAAGYIRHLGRHGTGLTALVSVVFFGEKADFIGIVSIGLILLGVVLLNTMSHMSGH